MNATNTQRGVSLLEVVIVFAITAVLAAISMPNFHEYGTRARVVEALEQAAPARAALVQTCMQDDHAVVKSNADAGYVHKRLSPDHDFVDRHFRRPLEFDNGIAWQVFRQQRVEIPEFLGTEASKPEQHDVDGGPFAR